MAKTPPKELIEQVAALASISFQESETLLQNLSSKEWRLNNLYYISDKSGKVRKFKLNKQQQKLLKEKHPRTIILKSRQIGISTFYTIEALDECLFVPNTQAGIQSYGQDESYKLQQKVELAWEKLPTVIKTLLDIDMEFNNKKGIGFTNGSILRIGNFRGDTLQKLHVSELGKISSKYPDKARELKTGAFQAVAAGNTISIESTAEGTGNLFHEMWDKAYRKKLTDAKLTPLDFNAIFFSWVDDKDCELDIPLQDIEVSPYTKEQVETYISDLKDTHDILLNDTQMAWLLLKVEELGLNDFNQEYPATPDHAFNRTVEGTYFLEQYNAILYEKRIKNVEHDPNYPVYAALDLGVNDETVILFAQYINGTVFIIDEYHNTGLAIDHYCDIIHSMTLSKGYKYGRVFLPHDAKNRDISVGSITREQLFRSYGITRITVLPKLSFRDSIDTARVMLKFTVINPKCDGTIACLQNYRKKYDSKLGVYLSSDVHDIHSNYAAALRYLAQGLSPATRSKRLKDVNRVHRERRKKYKRIRERDIGFAI